MDGGYLPAKPEEFREARKSTRSETAARGWMTQEELANEAGVSLKLIQNIESTSNKRSQKSFSYDLLLAVCQVLELDPGKNIRPVNVPEIVVVSKSLPFSLIPDLDDRDPKQRLIREIREGVIERADPMLFQDSEGNRFLKSSTEIRQHALEIGKGLIDGGMTNRVLDDLDRRIGEIYQEIVRVECEDLKGVLTHKCATPFYCTDTTIETLSPDAWDSHEAFVRLREVSEELASRFRVQLGRMWRVFILSTEYWLTAGEHRVQSFHSLVERQISSGITIGLVSRDAVPTGTPESMLNMYLMPGKAVVFGAQPVPMTARHVSDDLIGAGFVKMGEGLWGVLEQAMTHQRGGIRLHQALPLTEFRATLGSILATPAEGSSPIELKPGRTSTCDANH